MKRHNGPYFWYFFLQYFCDVIKKYVSNLHGFYFSVRWIGYFCFLPPIFIYWSSCSTVMVPRPVKVTKSIYAGCDEYKVEESRREGRCRGTKLKRGFSGLISPKSNIALLHYVWSLTHKSRSAREFSVINFCGRVSYVCHSLQHLGTVELQTPKKVIPVHVFVKWFWENCRPWFQIGSRSEISLFQIFFVTKNLNLFQLLETPVETHWRRSLLWLNESGYLQQYRVPPLQLDAVLNERSGPDGSYHSLVWYSLGLWRANSDMLHHRIDTWNHNQLN